MTAILSPFFLHPRPIHADQGVSLTASAEPKKATIGDRIHLDLRITHPNSFELRLSTATSFGDFLIVAANVETKTKKKEAVQDRLALQLVTFSTGTLKIPSIPLFLVQPQAESIIVQTPEIPIEIKSVLAKHKDRGDVQDIKGQIGFFNIVPWLIGLFIAAALGALFWWMWHKRKASMDRIHKPSVPALPPEIAARSALSALQSKKLIEQGRFKDFYIELSSILRQYAEGRFGLPCLDRTTSEIMTELKSGWLSSADFQLIRELFEQCDLVKFARFRPLPEEPPQHLKQALTFIDHTTLRQIPVSMGSHQNSNP